MKKLQIMLALTALSVGTANPVSAVAPKHHDDDKKDNTAAIVGGLAAIGIGIAIATSKHGDKHNHNNQWDGNLYGEPFSPAQNVVCLPRQQQCYERGYYSYSWTKRIFGISGGFGGSGGSGGSGGFGGSGGSWGGTTELDRARDVCVSRASERGLRNILVESVRGDGPKQARVVLQSRRSQMTVNYERWRCEYRYNSGKTKFKQL